MKKQDMIKQIRFDYKKKSGSNTIELSVDLSRFNKQYGYSQWFLDNQVMTDMVPYMPMQASVFINVTRGLSAAIAGSGSVYAAAPPMGRMLYEGKVMVDASTGSTWARKGAKKVLVSQYRGQTEAKEDIEFSKKAHPKVTAHWFEPAKKARGKKWISNAAHLAGGG